MSNLVFSLNATMPVFLVMVVGWILRRIGMLNEAFCNTANTYVFKVSLPVIPEKTLNSLAATATPIALIVVGAGFEGRSALAKLRPTVAATVIKLVILPLVALPLAVWCGFQGAELIAILIMVGAPTTVTSYVMAVNMDNDGPLSSSIIVLSTLLSSVTLTFWVYLLKSFALL